MIMIDIEKIRDYTGGDDEFILVLFDKFLARLNDDLNVLAKASEAKEWQDVRSKTHAMLSSARIFFLEEIVELSTKIEQDCEHQTTSDTPVSVKQLIELYKSARKEILTWKNT